jgi:maltose alpha-D-glucosyltransferase/alpha-amylase
MISVINFWCELGVDGFRLDAAPFLVKRKTTELSLSNPHYIFKKIREDIGKKYPEVAFLAEAHLPVDRTMEFFGEGDECQMVYNFGLMEAIYLSLMKQDPKVVSDMLERTSGIPPGTQWAVFLRNHDEISLATVDQGLRSELVSWLDPENGYLFSTGTSMRLASILGGDKEKILDAFRLQFSLPGSHVVYYGDEIGMKNEILRKNTADTRLAVRGIFDWSEAQRQEADPNSLLNGATKIINANREFINK